jgi:hypothetical protein
VAAEVGAEVAAEVRAEVAAEVRAVVAAEVREVAAEVREVEEAGGVVDKEMVVDGQVQQVIHLVEDVQIIKLKK